MGQRLVKSCLRPGHINGDVIERAVSSILECDLVVAIGERDGRMSKSMRSRMLMLWVRLRCSMHGGRALGRDERKGKSHLIIHNR